MRETRTVQIEAAVEMYGRVATARGGLMPAPTRGAQWLARRILQMRVCNGLVVKDASVVELAGFDPVTFRIVDYDRFYDWMERHGTRKRKKRRVT